MKLLAIESSCDDTAASLLEIQDKNFTILAEKTASQIDIHKIYGGVVPEVAARAHAEKIMPLVEDILAGTRPDAIAVTSGPGLLTALLVGVETARTLSALWDIPLFGINHIEGHIHSVLINEGAGALDLAFPAIALVVSGGHTEIILMKDYGEYERLGKTVDDAAGECFDKTAKLLDLEYPGGPKISKLAQNGKRDAIFFPRPLLRDPHLDFSFSGLKTAALYWLRDHTFDNQITKEDFCASFEEAIVDVLVQKSLRAIETHQPKTVILAGGVSANTHLRNTLTQAVQAHDPNIIVRLPEIKYGMDNATMIGASAIHHIQKQDAHDWKRLVADPNWHIGE